MGHVFRNGFAVLLLTGAAVGCTSSSTPNQACGAADAPGCPSSCWFDQQQTTLAVSETTIDFGKQPAGSSTDHTITITNVGSLSTGVLDGGVHFEPFTFKGAPSSGSDIGFPGIGGTCNAALAPGQNCTIVFTFAPINGPGSTFAGSAVVDYVLGSAGCGNGFGGGASPPSLSIQLTGSD